MVWPYSKVKLEAKCLECGHHDLRDYFYRELDLISPSFEDICPKCDGDDVDVYDPAVIIMEDLS